MVSGWAADHHAPVIDDHAAPLSLWRAAALVRFARSDLHHFPHALEDLPPEARREGSQIFSTPAGHAFQQRLFEILENAVLSAYGHLELLRLLAFLSRYPVTAYTYDLDADVSRGERPSAAKLRALAAQGFGVTVNLCAETPDGDLPALRTAAVAMRAEHIPVVDMTPPTVAQVVQLLRIVDEAEQQGTRVYVHCEAGKGRTGVMVACLRMATMGWSLADATREARNFGCQVPMQLAFIEDFAARLQAGRIPGWPRLPLGSVTPTAQQLSATLDSVAGGSREVS